MVDAQEGRKRSRAKARQARSAWRSANGKPEEEGKVKGEEREEGH